MVRRTTDDYEEMLDAILDSREGQRLGLERMAGSTGRWAEGASEAAKKARLASGEGMQDLLTRFGRGAEVFGPPEAPPSRLLQGLKIGGKGLGWALLAYLGYQILKEGWKKGDMGRAAFKTPEAASDRMFRSFDEAESVKAQGEDFDTARYLREGEGNVGGLGRMFEGTGRYMDRNFGGAELERLLEDHEDVIRGAAFRSPPSVAEIYMRHGVL